MLYKRLRDLREDMDLSQRKIAEILGIDQRVYSIYETGKRDIPAKYVVILADYYQTTTDYIFGRTNSK